MQVEIAAMGSTSYPNSTIPRHEEEAVVSFLKLGFKEETSNRQIGKRNREISVAGNKSAVKSYL